MSVPNPFRPLALLTACLLVTVTAQADDPVSGSFLLDTELYRGLEAEFGEVIAEEDGIGGLHVTVLLDPDVVGDAARVHRVYLSMDEWFEGLTVVPDDPETMKLSLRHQRSSWHTLGADFGAVVTIKQHSERRRHHWHRSREPLHEVGFTLVADKPLALARVLGMTSTWTEVVTQIGVDVHRLDVGRRHGAPGLLGGTFEADLPPVDDETPPNDDPGGPPGSLPPPEDGVVPPGCLGEFDPVTGELVRMFCF